MRSVVTRNVVMRRIAVYQPMDSGSRVMEARGLRNQFNRRTVLGELSVNNLEPLCDTPVKQSVKFARSSRPPPHPLTS
jgi:hypothetical protein